MELCALQHAVNRQYYTQEFPSSVASTYMNWHHLVISPVATYGTVGYSHHSTCRPDIVSRSFCNQGLIVVGLVKEQGMGNTWSQRLHPGLDERSHGVTSVPVHQTSLLMSTPGNHGLWNKQMHGKLELFISSWFYRWNTSHKTICSIFYLVSLHRDNCYKIIHT